MRKWEEKYKEIKSGKLHIRIGELESKLANKTITKEEYKELEKNKKIEENASKIDNILEYKAKLEGQLKEVKEEQARRKDLEDLGKQEKKLEEELKGLEASRASVERELKNKDISDDERVSLQAKLLDIKDKINQNQTNFSNNQMNFAAISKRQSKFVDMDMDTLNAKKTSISSKISKCNMICGKLVEGYSWDSIDIKLEQWQDRKFTAKKGTADKLKQATEVEKGELGKDITEKENSSQKDLVEVSEFDQKHPRLAKFKNFFKNIGKNIKEYFKQDKEDINSDEKSEEEKNKKEKDDFRNYIKVVAEKGMNQADKERLEAKRKEVKQKIAETKGREPGDE